MAARLLGGVLPVSGRERPTGRETDMDPSDRWLRAILFELRFHIRGHVDDVAGLASELGSYPAVAWPWSAPGGMRWSGWQVWAAVVCGWWGAGLCPFAVAGSVICTSSPPSGLAWAWAWPPWALATDATIDRPSPVPGRSPVLPERRRNGSNSPVTW